MRVLHLPLLSSSYPVLLVSQLQSAGMRPPHHLIPCRSCFLTEKQQYNGYLQTRVDCIIIMNAINIYTAKLKALNTQRALLAICGYLYCNEYAKNILNKEQLYHWYNYTSVSKNVYKIILSYLQPLILHDNPQIYKFTSS